MSFQNKRALAILVFIIFLLLVPLIGKAPWSLFDFVVAGVLLLAAGASVEVVMRLVKRLEYRIAIAAAIFVVLLLIWAEVAVGVFGTPLAGN